ncbi:MAG: Hsp20/alpha crystallin family protein [Candidatus Babeliales bacterium]
MPIIRWKPLEEIDEFFERMRHPDYGLDLALDMCEDEDNVYIDMHVPGIEADNIDIDVENQHVRIAGSRKEEHEDKEKNYYRKEIRRGAFERIVALPSSIHKEGVKAEVKDGILHVILPKEKRGASQKIKVTKK